LRTGGGIDVAVDPLHALQVGLGDLERIDLGFSYEETFSRPNPDAYVTLLMDVLAGDATLFMRADEVEAQWAILDPLLASIAERRPDPEPYEAGGPGPRAAYELLERDGRFWHKPDGLKSGGE